MRDEVSPICPRCGRPRLPTAPAGLCPRCLLGNALEDEADVTYLFAPEVPGRMLESLAATIGGFPRVLLPDTEGVEGSPMVQPSSPEMPAPADRPARVQLLGEIARGGMGAVLKGRDPDLGRDLAVKVLREEHRRRPELVRRFVEEAQIAGQLQHPGVVPVYELGCFADDRPYFTMKLVKGRTLAQLLADRPEAGAERPRFLGIFAQVAQTMAYAHARGVIHRDLKPSNVMVGAFGEVQVMDWGLAKVLPRGGAADDATAGRDSTPGQETVIATARSGSDTDSDLSRAGSVLGTPSYMAPEQARGEVERVDERADVFALGSILCEVLTGRPAFTGRTSGEIQRRAARGDLADALAQLASSGLDGELAALARDCLAAEPDDRPRDAGVVAARLAAYLTGVQERLHAAELAHAAEAARAEEALRTAEQSDARARAERRARKTTAGLAAAVLALVTLGGGGAAWLQRQQTMRREATVRLVDEALAEAMRIQNDAHDGGPAHWDAALAEARRAADLAAQGNAEAPVQRRVAAALDSLRRGRAEAERLATRDRVDRALLDRLAAASSDSWLLSKRATDDSFAAAFRAAGLDLDQTEADDAGAWVAARSVPVELAAFLDGWASIRAVITPGASRKPWTHLSAVARQADPDPWRNRLRAGLAGDRAALRALADDEGGLENQSVVSLNLLASTLWSWDKDAQRAERVLRLNWMRHPDDYLVNLGLASLHDARTPSSPDQAARWQVERVRFLTAAAAARPNAASFNALGYALSQFGRVEDAEAAYREAIRRDPARTLSRSQLGNLLLTHDREDEGLALVREAARPGAGPIEYFNLGFALHRLGRLEQAVAAYREAVRLDGPHAGEAIRNLGHVYRRLGRHDEAGETFLRACELARAEGNVDHSRTFRNEVLPDARALLAQGRRDEGLRLLREVANLRNAGPVEHYNLAIHQEQMGLLDEALHEYREAVRLDGERLGEAVFGLGRLLGVFGRADEAAKTLRRAAEQAQRDGATDQVQRAEALLRDVARWKALSDRLPAFRAGTDRPRKATELFDVMWICQARRLYATGAQIAEGAFRADPTLADDPGLPNRRNAACHAVRAGSGEGAENPPPDAAECARLRGLALGWLRAQLTAWRDRLRDANPDGRANVARGLEELRTERDLAVVREPAALTSLPDQERQSWQALWAEVDSLLAKARGTNR